jgi:hypothetical protein
MLMHSFNDTIEGINKDHVLDMKDKLTLWLTPRILLTIAMTALYQVMWIQPVAAQSHSLNNYQKLRDAVLQGKEIYGVVDLRHCMSHGLSQVGPSVIGVQHFSAFMLKNNGDIAFSSSHLAIHPDGKAINEVLSFTIAPNNFVELRNAFVDPLTYHSDRVDMFDCKVGEGIALGW